MDQNFRHGTPLRLFHEQLSKGFFNPEISKMRALHKKILYREYRYVDELLSYGPFMFINSVLINFFGNE